MAVREVRGVFTPAFDQEPVTYNAFNIPDIIESEGRVTSSGMITVPMAPSIFPPSGTESQLLAKNVPRGKETAESVAKGVAVDQYGTIIPNQGDSKWLYLVLFLIAAWFILK